MSKALYEAWGPEGSLKAFVHYPANTYAEQHVELHDNSHSNTYGAYELARCIARGIADAGLPIARYLFPEKLTFMPSQPDPAARWYWPLSPMATATKPDGN